MTRRCERRYFPSVMNRWQHTGAFVVQFCAEAEEAAEGNFQGRVEHVATSRGMHFDSSAELIAFFEKALAHARAGTPDLEHSDITNMTTGTEE
jgi:hypothetical protein